MWREWSHEIGERASEDKTNARTDIYLRGLAPEPARTGAALERARQYRNAGADGLFVPKVVQAADIRAIASSTKLPLNVLAWPGLPSGEELSALGVRRLSAGSAIAHATWNRAAALTRDFLVDGRISPTAGEPSMSYAEINSLLAQR